MGGLAEQAGRRPDEGDLLRLADAQQRTGNTNGYILTLEKLLANYPKKDYWSAYLGRLTRKSGFSQGLGLDVMRLRLASGTLEKTEDFMEMAQLAIQAGLPAEGVQIVDKGFAAGALGKGEEAGRHQRLKELALKRDADKKASIAADAAAAAAVKEGDALVEVGYAYVTMGQVDQGVKLIEQGIAKGNLKRAELAKLRLDLGLASSSRSLYLLSVLTHSRFFERICSKRLQISLILPFGSESSCHFMPLGGPVGCLFAAVAQGLRLAESDGRVSAKCLSPLVAFCMNNQFS